MIFVMHSDSEHSAWVTFGTGQSVGAQTFGRIMGILQDSGHFAG